MRINDLCFSFVVVVVCNIRWIILCQVVLGSVEKVELELNQTCANRKEFDIGSDDPKNPKWYVVCANDINTRILTNTETYLNIKFNIFNHSLTKQNHSLIFIALTQ